MSNELNYNEAHSLLETDCHHDMEIKIGSLRPYCLDDIGSILTVIMADSNILQCVILYHLATHYLIFKMTLG